MATPNAFFRRANTNLLKKFATVVEVKRTKGRGNSISNLARGFSVGE